MLSWLKKNEKVIYLLLAIIGGIVGLITFIDNKLERRKNAEADLTVASAKYERETPKYRVYAIKFVINNSGNQNVILRQALPYGLPGKGNPDLRLPDLRLLQNNNCESFEDAEVKAGELKIFTVHAFLDKQVIELSKNMEAYLKQSGPNVGFQKPQKINTTIPAVIEVKIYSADKKYMSATSLRIELSFMNGTEENVRLPEMHVNFKDSEKNLIECPIKET